MQSGGGENSGHYDNLDYDHDNDNDATAFANLSPLGRWERRTPVRRGLASDRSVAFCG